MKFSKLRFNEGQSSRAGGIRLSLWVQLSLITATFVGVYFILRNLPNAQCDFLHYEVIEVLADGTEVCAATNHAKFVDLTVYKYPVSMEAEVVNIDAETGMHHFEAVFLGKDERPLLPHELAVTHTERIHLMVVDPSLDDYHHVHPQALGATGKYEFSFIPAGPGPFKFYAELVPVQTKRQAITYKYQSFDPAVLTSVGAALGSGFSGEPVLRTEVDDYIFEIELQTVQNTIRLRRDNPLTLKVTHKDGTPIELEEIMGDYAHLVAFDESRTGFAHMHPLERRLAASPGPEVDFLFYSPKTGHHRIWAQVQIAGREVFAPFDVFVQ